MAEASTPEKATTLVTPKAIVYGYVNVTKPDTKYKPEGEFKIRVAIKKTEPGAVELYQKLAEQAEAELAKVNDRAKKDPKFKATLKGKAPKAADLPFYEDDEGNFIFTFKSKASYVSKKPGTEGETITRVVPIWGPGGRYAPADVPKFGAGSVVKVSFVSAGFFTAAVGAGVTLRLEAVKVLVVKEFTGGSGTDPFGDEEGEPSDESNGAEFGDEGGNAAPDDEF